MKKEKNNKYYWKYNINLYKNPTILFLLFKIFGYILLGIYIFNLIISFNNINFWWNGFIENLKLFIIITIIIFILCILGYYLYAYIMNGTYNIIFEMDEKGIKHTQELKQINKYKKISILTIILGILNKNNMVTGIGLNTYKKDSIYTNFKTIKKIKYYPNKNKIILNTSNGQNQIYANKEDINFIYEYILKNK